MNQIILEHYIYKSSQRIISSWFFFGTIDFGLLIRDNFELKIYHLYPNLLYSCKTAL